MGSTEMRVGLCRTVETQELFSIVAAAATKDTVLANTTRLWPRLQWLGWGEAALGFSCVCAEGSLQRLGLVLPIATTSTACFALHDLFGSHWQLFYSISMPVPFFMTQV